MFSVQRNLVRLGILGSVFLVSCSPLTSSSKTEGPSGEEVHVVELGAAEVKVSKSSTWEKPSDASVQFAIATRQENGKKSHSLQMHAQVSVPGQRRADFKSSVILRLTLGDKKMALSPDPVSIEDRLEAGHQVMAARFPLNRDQLNRLRDARKVEYKITFIGDLELSGKLPPNSPDILKTL